jgi:heat shock protein HslJ
MIRRILFFSFAILMFASCRQSKKISEKIAAVQNKLINPDSTLQEKQKTGIDLIAIGSDPSEWNLELDLDKELVFKSNNLNVRASSIKLLPVADMNGVSYGATTDVGPIVINVFNEKCNKEGYVNNLLNKRIEVILSDTQKIYKGCGNYTYNSRINHRWMLEYIDTVKQLEWSYARGLPRMELNMTEGKMFGFDGCNEVSAKIEVRGKRIKFYNIWDNKSISCSNKLGKQLYADFVSEQLLEYKLINDKLILYVAGDKRLIFKHPKK